MMIYNLYSKKILLIALLMVFGIQLEAQFTIEQQVQQYAEPNYVLITKGRSLLYDKLQQGNIDEAKKVKDYLLDSLTTTKQAALRPNELLFVKFLLNDYDAVLQYLTSIDSLDKTYWYVKYPADDALFPNLCSLTQRYQDTLAWQIQQLPYNSLDKDILQLTLSMCTLACNDSNYYDKETVNDIKANQLANQFLANHPNSKYDAVVKKYLRHEYKASKFSWGMELYGGYGWFTGNLSDQFTNPGLIGISFDFYYQRFAAFARINLGFNKNRNDIPFDAGVWAQKTATTFAFPEIHFGYQACSTKNIVFVPFAGIGAAAMEPSDKKKPELDGVKGISAWNFGVGAFTDFKINSGNIKGIENGYWSIRLRYTYYMPRFSDPYTGAIHTLTIGFGGLGRTVKRNIN